VEIQDCDGGTSQQWKIHADSTITGVASGLCLDITGTGNGAALMLATCDQGANQKWTRR